MLFWSTWIADHVWWEDQIFFTSERVWGFRDKHMLNEELAPDLAKFDKKDGFKIRKAKVLQQISGDLLNLRCKLISCINA